jgi:hypothetical protein
MRADLRLPIGPSGLPNGFRRLGSRVLFPLPQEFVRFAGAVVGKQNIRHTNNFPHLVNTGFVNAFESAPGSCVSITLPASS